jgi:hypothetical protein
VKVTIDDLKTFGLYDRLPQKFKIFVAGQFYVFYYTTIDEETKLKVFEDDIVLNVNIALYRRVSALYKEGKVLESEQVSVGYFAGDSFESRNGIFFLFLNTYCDRADVDKFYEWCVSNDKAGDYQIATSALNDVYDRSAFERILSFFTSDKVIPSVMKVYDMLDAYLAKKRLSLYGGFIKKVVQLIPYESGVLPEKNGKMRFMVIGEFAVLSSAEEDKLLAAKIYLRSLVNPVEIYKKTGWFFNGADGKWRYNTTDVGSYIAENNLRPINGNRVYSPARRPLDVAEVDTLFKNPEALYDTAYAGVLSEVLKHPTLYQRYPKLANMPLLFRDNKKESFGTFYYTYNNLLGFMVIDGNADNVNLVSVMLHETQHAIQKIEDFGSGGNTFLSSFVMAIGGENVRKVFFNIKNLEYAFANKITSEEQYEELRTIVDNLAVRDASTMDLKDKLISFSKSYDKLRNSLDMFAVYSAFYLAQMKQLAHGSYIDYLADLTDNNIFTLTELIDEGFEASARMRDSLNAQGYTQEDVQRIMFNAYEDLMGETESRSVQHGMMVDGKYSNYFFLYNWENAPSRKIAVINDEYIDIDTKKIQAAIETISDGYILHFKKVYDVEPFLHELGHIVHDILVRDGYGQRIETEFANAVTSKTIDEYFVDCFLGYIREHVYDENIETSLYRNIELKNNSEINELLDYIFSTDELASDYKRFINTVISEVESEDKP